MAIENIRNTKHRFSDVMGEPCIKLAPITGYSRLPLVTLEEATERLKGIVPNIETHVHVAKERVTQPIKTLTVDESASIALYTMEWEPYVHSVYYILNSTLRTEDRGKLKPWFWYLKLILTALSKLPSTELTVFRGMRSEIEGGYEKYEVGKEIIWWGFSSCSKIQTIAEKDQFMGETGQRALFIIDCLNGKDVSRHSYFGKEKEILLRPATSVQVVRKEFREDGVLLIHLQEIISQFKYIEDPIPTDTVPPDDIETQSVLSDEPSADRAGPDRYFNPRLNEDLSRFRPRSEVYLLGRRFNANDMEIIAKKSVQENQSRGLFLRESGITSDGAVVIARALSSPNSLERLFISHNSIGDIGAIALARALRSNVTLKQLCLGYDEITDDGVDHIGTTLEMNRTLTHLWLPSNRITERGLKRLAEVLTNTNRTLQVLSLEWNKFSSENSVDILLGMLRNNRSLTTLNLNNCRLPRSAIRQLKNEARNKKNFLLTIH